MADRNKDGQATQPAELPDTVPAGINPLDRARRRSELRGLRDVSFDQLVRDAKEGRIRAVDASQAGIGFKLIEGDQKRFLVGVPLAVLPGWQVNKSDKFGGAYFVSAYVRTQRPVPQLGDYEAFILNDGSTGIALQLADLRKAAEEAGEDDPMVFCRRGLKVSTYKVTDDQIDEATGQPVMDPLTRKPVQVPRRDPVTDQEITGTTYYLDETV